MPRNFGHLPRNVVLGDGARHKPPRSEFVRSNANPREPRELAPDQQLERRHCGDFSPMSIDPIEIGKEIGEPILQFFAFAHLPPHLQVVSEKFAGLAVEIVHNLPRNPERTVALRKLLEAKDAAVRARLMQ